MQVSLTEMKNRGGKNVYSNIRIETNKITIISFAGKTVAANIKMNYQLILKDISVL